ncbi:response regulator transcription factor [Mucilaginibacter sp. RS28]|uniref:Response regulator transcription factor n=1 Tax=Mucilaginibacter straminoryzae TaxID=2932774 RepID=A0A9X2BBU1_9SPHI|nr:response regulator transcription factor [Mucilaginibacter straminoryzae]MCJ8212070.1 response regulator transcription factor [Mucilaginibacter straminoryzae]
MLAVPKTVLVVEDDHDIRELIVIILEADGYEVASLDSGRDVILTVQRTSPDILLLDVMLGDMDGRDICKALKSSPATSQMPVMIVSATHGWETRHERQCMADDYVAKPFDITDLLVRVSNLVNRKSA